MRVLDLTNYQTTLSEEQMDRLKELVELCEAENLLARPGELDDDDLVDGLNDSDTLLQFLRARSFDSKGAFEQFKKAAAIRDSIGSIAAYDAADIKEFEETRRLYPHWSGRRDNEGKPIFIFDLAQIGSDLLKGYRDSRNTSYSVDTTRQAVVFQDYLVRFVLPLCNAMPDRKGSESGAIKSAVYLVDASTLSLRQTWSMKEYLQDLTSILATCYPETLDRVYALNAPSYFGIMWSILTTFIDPGTRFKLQIVSKANILSVLSSTIDVNDIPTQFGGNHEMQHGMLPTVDDKIGESVAWSTGSTSCLPKGPIKLSATSDGRVELVAVGSETGQQRRNVIGHLCI